MKVNSVRKSSPEPVNFATELGSKFRYLTFQPPTPTCKIKGCDSFTARYTNELYTLYDETDTVEVKNRKIQVAGKLLYNVRTGSLQKAYCS